LVVEGSTVQFCKPPVNEWTRQWSEPLVISQHYPLMITCHTVQSILSCLKPGSSLGRSAGHFGLPCTLVVAAWFGPSNGAGANEMFLSVSAVCAVLSRHHAATITKNTRLVSVLALHSSPADRQWHASPWASAWQPPTLFLVLTFSVAFRIHTTQLPHNRDELTQASARSAVPHELYVLCAEVALKHRMLETADSVLELLFGLNPPPADAAAAYLCRAQVSTAADHCKSYDHQESFARFFRSLPRLLCLHPSPPVRLPLPISPLCCCEHAHPLFVRP
jgi:hypothetical protein